MSNKEYAKEWRRKNPEKIKAYLEKTKEHRKEVNDEWRKKNPERVKKSDLNSYYNNKNNHTNRTRTREAIKEGIIILERECEHIENLEIHHESYPLKKKDIIKAVFNNEIYYLCRKCHVAKHKQINKTLLETNGK